jgi:hypothetical protein
MEDLRPKTILFCGVLALAIALSVLLRGRRAVHWLFAADVALWYASQSLSGFFRPDLWERVTGVLSPALAGAAPESEPRFRLARPSRETSRPVGRVGGVPLGRGYEEDADVAPILAFTTLRSRRS